MIQTYTFWTYLTPCSSCNGLGLATVQNLFDAGAYISILDIKENAELIKKLGKRGKYFEVDIREDSQIKTAVDASVAWTQETNATLGGVVNCAGVATASKVCHHIHEL